MAAWVLGIPLTFSGWLLASAAMYFAAVALPIVPGQVGVQEAALTGALTTVGLDPSQGLAIAILLRMRQLAFVPLGFAIATSPLNAPRTEAADGDALERSQG